MHSSSDSIKFKSYNYANEVVDVLLSHFVQDIKEIEKHQ